MNDQDVELLEWCQGLGQTDKATPNSGFTPGDEALMCLKGVDGMLRHDNKELQPMHLRLGAWHTVRTHILPLLFTCCKKRPIVYQCMLILVRLTTPLTAIVENKAVRLEHLQETKAWFLEGQYLTTLMWILSSALEQHPTMRTKEDRNFMDLILMLIKNLLSVPDPIAGDEHKKKLHDRCIVAMHEALVFDTLAVLAATIDSTTDTSTKYLLQDCLIQIFRLEKHVEDLFMDEASEAAEKKELAAKMLSEAANDGAGKEGAVKQPKDSKSKSKSATPAASSSASTAVDSSQPQHQSRKLAPSSMFMDSEASRLSANLAASLEASRMTTRANDKIGMARHARFGSKYSKTVVVDPLTANGVAKQFHAATQGPNGEAVHMAIPSTNTVGQAVFAERLVRNPFGAPNQNRMVTDSLAIHTGSKHALAAERRVFLMPEVKLALHKTASEMLDSGAWNTLARHMLRELDAAATKDVVASEDARAYMSLSGFFMSFQRLRSKRLVRAGEIKQKAREKKEEAAEKKLRDAEEKKRLDEQALQEMETARLKADRALLDAVVEGSSSSALLSEGLASAAAAADAPAFPNMVNSAGEMSHAAETQASAAPVSDRPWLGLDDGIDETLPQAEVVPPKPAAPIKKPWVREVMYDVSPISVSISFDAWKYLLTRMKLYMEDKPVQWAHLAAAVAMYKELLRSLYEMHSCGSVAARLKADNLRRALFYDRESLELFSKLVQSWNAARIDHDYMADLVTSIHYQCKLLEDLAKPGAGFTVLEKRRRVVRRKKDKKIDIRNPEDVEALKVGDGENEESLVPDSEELKESLPAQPVFEELPESDPFMDSDDEQKEPGAAAAAASSSSAPSSPVKKRKTIFAHDHDDEEMGYGEEPSSPKKSKSKTSSEDSEPGAEVESTQVEVEGETKENEKHTTATDAAAAAAVGTVENEDDEEYEDVEIEEDVPTTSRRESEFNFQQYLIRFAHSGVVSAYLSLLSHYRRNHTETNHMILVFFQRLSKSHLNGFFFQLRAFILFEQILTDEWIKARPVYDDLRSWVKGLTRQFLELAMRKPTEDELASDPDLELHPGRHLWLELLFWKNMESADKLLNENGWFDRSKDRAQSMRDAQMYAEREDEWVDVDEEEEEIKAAARAEALAESMGGEAEAPADAWVNSDVHIRAKAWTKEEDKLLSSQYSEYKDTEEYLEILKSFFPQRSVVSIRDRLKKLGVLEKRARGEKKEKMSATAKRAAKKKASTLADRIDPHDCYAKVPDIDGCLEPIRELVDELKEKSCGSSVALMLEQLKACRDSRARVEDDPDLTEVFAFESQEAEGWDHDATPQFNTMFQYMGLPDEPLKDGAWTVPKHFTSANLTAFIDLIQGTLDSASSSAARDEDVENDAAISRLIAQSSAVHDEDNGGDDDDEVEAEQARLEKAAKRARRLERERAEAAELAASSQEARPRRRRADELAAERLRVKREADDRRRAQQAADDAAEEEYTGDSSTALGAAAVAASNAAELTPARNFAKSDLNDYMERKLQRNRDAQAERARKLEESAQLESSRKKKRGSESTIVSPPKRVKQDGKKRLHRAANSADEEAPVVVQREAQDTPTDSPTAVEGEVEGEATLVLADQADETMLPQGEGDVDEEEEAIPAPVRKSKKKARRIVESDDDDEEAALEDEPMSQDADASQPNDTTTVDTQAETQQPDESDTPAVASILPATMPIDQEDEAMDT